MANSPRANDRSAPPLVQVVLVGTGDRARTWLPLVQRSTRLRLVAAVARSGEPLASEVRCYRSLEEALAEHPQASFAIALPPRAATESALLLARAARPAVIEAPLHHFLLNAQLPASASQVRVAHGWTTLAGTRQVKGIIAAATTGRLHLEVAGLPEDEHGDLEEVLVHALALLNALDPSLAPRGAQVGQQGELAINLSSTTEARTWQVQLRVFTRGRRMALRAQAGNRVVQWSCDRDREQLHVDGKSLLTPHRIASASVRALAQLLPDADAGDSLGDAAVALELTRQALALLPTRLPQGSRAFRQSQSIAKRRPSDLLAQLGLIASPLPAFPRGEDQGEGSGQELTSIATTGLPKRAVDVGRLALELPPEPFELWPFLAGIKPVVFLTVRPEDVARTLSWFGEVHCERRERRVEVGPQDQWSDQRERGTPMVELYLARDPELARRAVRLQADADPSAAIRELGALVGYPRCCVEAFARQDDRSNNSRNRYFSWARTLTPRGDDHGAWPWELNNLHTMLAPFYPCSYRCEQALAWVRGALQRAGREHAAYVASLQQVLAQPVLYFDHDHQLTFDGHCDQAGVSYRSVQLSCDPTTGILELAAVIAQGNRLSLDEHRLAVERDGRIILSLERTDPGLGFLAPFGVL